MSAKYFTLSKKEKELMDIFWESDSPLARSEILECAKERQCSWKPNSVHILLNSLLEKNAVQVAGLYLNSRKLGRTFEPAITRDEYAIMQVVIAADKAKEEGVSDCDCLLAALIGDGTDVSVLDAAAKAIKAKKKELETQND